MQEGSMRTRHVAVLASTIAATVGLGIAVALPASAAELLANPGFESGTLSGWTCESVDSVVSGQSHSGTYSLSGNPTNSVTAQCQQTVNVVPSTAYTLSGFVNGAYVFLGVTGGVDASTWTPTTSGAYAKLTVAFTTAASQHTAVVYVHGWY